MLVQLKVPQSKNLVLTDYEKKASGPAIDNSLTSRFAAIDFGKIRRAFNKEYRVPKIELPVKAARYLAIMMEQLIWIPS